MATRMLQRRGTAAEWAASNPVLGDGEIGYVRETGLVKIGDGVTAWNALPNEYIRKSTMDDLYVARSMADALGDLFVGSGPDTIQRLPRGTTGQRLTVQADGTLAWQDLPAVSNPFAIVDAAGDLLVGSGNDAVGRLAKGANGQVLTVNGSGAVVWATPTASDTTKVAKTGDTMTGRLILPSGLGLLIGDSLLREDNGAFRMVNGADNTWRNLNAGGVYGNTGVYDNGNRVYSASNPPPASGMTILAGAPKFAVTNAFSTAFTFVAPASGRVVAHGYFTNGAGQLYLSINGGTTNFLSTRWSGYAPIDAPVPFTGLTPGSTYTLSVTDYTGNTEANIFVEG